MFLAMLCGEYHDKYSDYYSYVYSSEEDKWDVPNEAEYWMQGYACIRELQGPVHPDFVEFAYGKSVHKAPYHAPTFADLLKEAS